MGALDEGVNDRSAAVDSLGGGVDGIGIRGCSGARSACRGPLAVARLPSNADSNPYIGGVLRGRFPNFVWRNVSHRLAELLFQGVNADHGEAVRWYRMAAGQDDAAAQNNLGACRA